MSSRVTKKRYAPSPGTPSTPSWSQEARKAQSSTGTYRLQTSRTQAQVRPRTSVPTHLYPTPARRSLKHTTQTSGRWPTTHLDIYSSVGRTTIRRGFGAANDQAILRLCSRVEERSHRISSICLDRTMTTTLWFPGSGTQAERLPEWEEQALEE